MTSIIFYLTTPLMRSNYHIVAVDHLPRVGDHVQFNDGTFQVTDVVHRLETSDTGARYVDSIRVYATQVHVEL